MTTMSALRAAFILIIFCCSGISITYALPSSTLASTDITEELRRYLEGQNPAYLNDTTLHTPELLNGFYLQRAYRPAWLDSGHRVAASADQFLTALHSAGQDGLQPEFYHLQRINEAIDRIRGLSGVSALQFAEFELLMSDSFFTYALHMTRGRLNPRQFNPDWSWQNRSLDLVALLEQAVSTGDIASLLLRLQPPHQGYRVLKTALAHYRDVAQAGGWSAIDSGATLHKGMRHARVKALHARLLASGDLPRSDAHPDDRIATQDSTQAEADKEPDAAQTLFTEVLHQAVLRFQKRHGLFVDGLVGKHTLAALNVPVSERISQIELNMERWRWLPEDLGERHILVNIPSFEMQVVEHGETMLRSKVVVGRGDRPTPVFSASMSHLVISPYWYVPRTIAIQDKLPLLRKNPRSLKRQKIRVFNSAGREVNPAHINWYGVGKKNFNYRLRQDPGPRNALGTIKFMFPNRHSVYLHDTSSPELFEEAQRSYSSGCVRVAKPMELAEYLLRDNPDWTRETITGAIDHGRQRKVMLSEEIPVHLLYWTVWQDEDGLVQFRQDIYQHDHSLTQALNTIETRYAKL